MCGEGVGREDFNAIEHNLPTYLPTHLPMYTHLHTYSSQKGSEYVLGRGGYVTVVLYNDKKTYTLT